MLQKLFLLVFLFITPQLFAQHKDTVLKIGGETILLADSVIKADTVVKKGMHSPRKATIRSAILPGWGQAYNKKYWKIPIVWGALGTTIGFFVYNRTEYVNSRDAYRYLLDTNLTREQALALMKPKFRNAFPESIRQYRNSVRRDLDYTVLVFLLLWGLNIVDATVDGHLKEFDVSENLSLRVNPSYLPATSQANVGLVFSFGKNKTR